MDKATFDTFITSLRMIQSSAAVIGNLLTLICVVKYRSLHNSAGVLVTSLALSDTIHGLIVYTLPVRSQIKGICISSMAAETYTLAVQLMTFFLLAMERRNSLLAQLQRASKWRVKNTILIVIGGWISLGIFIIVFAISTGDLTEDDICTQAAAFPMIYIQVNIAIDILSTVMTIAVYISIAKVIYSSSRQVATAAAPFQNSQQMNQHRAGIRITKMMALVVGVFIALHFPMGLSFGTMKESPPFWRYVIHKLSIVLSDVNFWINPAIYAWRNKQFRQAFKQMFSPCRASNSGVVPDIELQVNTVSVRVSQYMIPQVAIPGPSYLNQPTLHTLVPRDNFGDLRPTLSTVEV